MPRTAIPVPEDFRETARNHFNVELMARYGVSEHIIARWRKQLGVPAPAPNRKGVKRRPPEIDTPEQIAMCIGCKRDDCNGERLMMRLAKMGSRVCYT